MTTLEWIETEGPGPNRPGSFGIQTVSVHLLDVSPSGNDRTHFLPETLQALADDIAENGQTSPVIVRPKGSRYEIVAGETRTRAIRDVLCQETITVDVRELSDKQARAIMLSENTVRADLDPIDLGRAWAMRQAENGWSLAETARQVHKSPSTVQDHMSLLALAPELQEMVRTKQLTIQRGRQLNSLEHAAQRSAVVQGAELGTEAFARLVSKMQAEQDQAGLFELEALKQETYDLAAGKYVEEVKAEDEIDVLVGPREVADRLNVGRPTVAQWRKRYADFPTPLAYLSDGARQVPGKPMSPGLPVWQWAQIREWAVRTGRI